MVHCRNPASSVSQTLRVGSPMDMLRGSGTAILLQIECLEDCWDDNRMPRTVFHFIAGFSCRFLERCFGNSPPSEVGTSHKAWLVGRSPFSSGL